MIKSSVVFRLICDSLNSLQVMESPSILVFEFVVERINQMSRMCHDLLIKTHIEPIMITERVRLKIWMSNETRSEFCFHWNISSDTIRSIRQLIFGLASGNEYYCWTCSNAMYHLHTVINDVGRICRRQNEWNFPMSSGRIYDRWALTYLRWLTTMYSD